MSHEEDDEKSIESTKAPLMEHLIELRSRLIKALIAFGLAFVVCFFFAKTIYNVLTWPYVWVAGPDPKFIYTGLLEYFVVQLKLGMFGAAFISFPVVATQIYMFVAPGLYRHERKAFLPYLVATPFFFALGSAVVYFLVMPMLVKFSVGMQQAPGEGTAQRRVRVGVEHGLVEQTVGELTEVVINVAEVEVRLEEVRLEANRALVQRLRFRQLVMAVVNVREVDQRRDEIRIVFQRFPIRSSRFVLTAFIPIVER